MVPTRIHYKLCKICTEPNKGGSAGTALLAGIGPESVPTGHAQDSRECRVLGKANIRWYLNHVGNAATSDIPHSATSSLKS